MTVRGQTPRGQSAVALAAAYYIKIVKVMYFDEPVDTAPIDAPGSLRTMLSLNGAAVEKAKAAKLHPMIRADLVDLILSFAPGAVPVEADAPNS